MTERGKKILDGKRERFLGLLHKTSLENINMEKNALLTPDQARVGYEWIMELKAEKSRTEAAQKARAEQIAAGAAGGPRGVMDRRGDAIRRDIEARSQAIRLIEESEALSRRQDEVYAEGMGIGFRKASWRTLRCCMAAACLALREAYDLSDEDIFRGIKTLYDKAAWAMEYSEMADEVLEKVGIQLNLDDPVEPVRVIR